MNPAAPTENNGAPLPRVLVVDDDRQFMLVVSTYLQVEGYRVISAYDGQTGLELAVKERPDLIVLDVDMPVLTGVEVCRELRRLKVAVPILMLTGRGQVDARVTGLDAGADDYVVKPVDAREFLARLRALGRRKQRVQQQAIVLHLGPIEIDLGRRVAKRGAEPLKLTKKEFALLDLLAQHIGQPVSRETMLDVIWGYARFPSTRTVDTHIWRLRNKIGDAGDSPRWIKNVQGQGYVLAEDAVK
jgi:DNA-binding response OmpR family regulator